MDHPFENVRLILATGQGRSGTTVLTKAIGEHPDVYSNLVESNVIKSILEACLENVTKPSRVAQMLVDRADHDRLFRQFILHLQFPIKKLPSGKVPQAISTFSAMSPPVAEIAAQVFPNIHFANIIRNGIEVVSSRMVHKTLGEHSFERQCVAWAAALDMVQWGAGRNDFSLFRHEQLLDEVACHAQFRRLMERAQLTPTSACSNYVLTNQHNQTAYPSEPSEQHQDLSRRVERHKHWSDGQRQQFVDICGEAMKILGYEIPWL